MQGANRKVAPQDPPAAAKSGNKPEAKPTQGPARASPDPAMGSKDGQSQDAPAKGSDRNISPQTAQQPQTEEEKEKKAHPQQYAVDPRDPKGKMTPQSTATNPQQAAKQVVVDSGCIDDVGGAGVSQAV